VVGEVGRVHVNVRWATLEEYGRVEEAAEIESELFTRLTDPAERDELQSEFDRAVKRAFESEAFYAQPFVVLRGRSIEVLVIISAVYTAIVKVNEVVDALTKAADALRRLIHFVASGGFGVGPSALPPELQPTIGASWSLGAGVFPLGGVAPGGLASLPSRTLIRLAVGSLLYLAALCAIAVLTLYGFNHFAS
jgi:hypothetical protein